MNIERCAELFAAFSGKELFVGFSGGADSTAALLVTNHFARRFGFAVTAVHINHHLRGAESDREEAAAEKFARDRGIAYRCFHLSGLDGGNLEARAREERLKIWQQLTAGKESAVVLGHHRDDRIETLFMRLLRGSNVSGLAALRTRRMLGNVTVLRPLLYFSRAEIEAFLLENNVETFAMDSSNSEDKYLRNFLRNNILTRLVEKVPHALTDLEHSLNALTEDAEFLEQEAVRRYQTVKGFGKLPVSFWRELHPALQVRVLRLFIGGNYIPDGAFIRRFRQEIGRFENEKRLLPFRNEEYLAIQGEWLWIEKAQTPRQTICWMWSECSRIYWEDELFECELVSVMPETMDFDCCCFDADKLPPEFYLTCRRAGDTLIPFGKASAVSLKKLRTDRKLSADFDLPVFRDEAGLILWAPGIRQSAYAPVTAETRKILLIRHGGKR